tara:strand:+ start:1177 stop:1716 length:540 start_codon:yes stop_codon:yes gene_type:complete
MAFNKTKKGGKKHLPMKKKGKYTAKRTAKKNKTSKKKGGFSVKDMKNKISEKMTDMKDKINDLNFFIQYKTKGILGGFKNVLVGKASTFASKVDEDGNRKQVEITGVRSNISKVIAEKLFKKKDDFDKQDNYPDYVILYKSIAETDNNIYNKNYKDFINEYPFYRTNNEFYEVTNSYKE